MKESTASNVRTCFNVNVVLHRAITVKTVMHQSNAQPGVETNVVKNANCHPVGNVRRNTALAVVTIVKVARSIFVSVMKHGKIVQPKNAGKGFVHSAHPSAKSAKDCSAVVTARVVHAASRVFAMIAMIFVNARAVGKGVNVLDATRRIRRDLQISILS